MSSAPRPPSPRTLANLERRQKVLLDLLKQRREQPLDAPEEEDQAPEDLGPPPDELTLTASALHGLAGQVVRSLAPHSEADPAAILLQFLAAFGNLLGPAPHALVGSTRHGLNLFVVLVGNSSKGRKGTSWRQVSTLFAEADPYWAFDRIATARPTPSSILHMLRDHKTVTDRRLFLLAEEFASILHLLGRQSGQLSPLLRSAWDGGDLCASDGRHPVQATAAHISLVGHITQSELARHLGRNESHNGFANRCLWTSVRRSQSLPEGGSLPPDQSAALTRELSRALGWAQSQPQLLFRRTEAARELWMDRYAALSESRPDTYGAATSRAEAQVLRLSAIYAALDSSPLVETCHLQAALAVWDYCQASARLIFDSAPIDPIARRISEAVVSSPEGLTKTKIFGLFHGHVSPERINLALEQLRALDFLAPRTAAGRGRPATLWTTTETGSPGGLN